MAADERIALSEARDSRLEVVADGLAQKRDVVAPVAIGQGGDTRVLLPARRAVYLP
jgi:hypothetical protein